MPLLCQLSGTVNDCRELAEKEAFDCGPAGCQTAARQILPSHLPLEISTCDVLVFNEVRDIVTSCWRKYLGVEGLDDTQSWTKGALYY